MMRAPCRWALAAALAVLLSLAPVAQSQARALLAGFRCLRPRVRL
jgi:hypothetical protein